MNTYLVPGIIVYMAHDMPGIRKGPYVKEKLEGFVIYISSTCMLRGRSYLFTGLYDTITSPHLLLNDHIAQQSIYMFDEYY